jgi:hypothetical protein
MQKLQQKGRDINDYYIMDVMEEVNGESLSQDIVNRYSLPRASTYVNICEDCEMFK